MLKGVFGRHVSSLHYVSLVPTACVFKATASKIYYFIDGHLKWRENVNVVQMRRQTMMLFFFLRRVNSGPSGDNKKQVI